MALNPINLDLTERLKDHWWAVEYVACLEEAQKDSDKRYTKRIAELEARIVDLEVFVHVVSASTKTEVDADNWREWKEWADELIK